jgi:DNA polymerase-1
MKKVLLIDGMSLLFRAFHAMPPMVTKDGIATGALYGFLKLYYGIVEKEKPDLIAVCLDRKEKTFRAEADDTYKANRPPPPDDMVSQLVAFPKMLSDLGIPQMSLAGFEADDLIATIAKKESSKGNKVVIVSGDRDILQIVDENITAVINKKGISEVESYGPKELAEKIGLTTEQYVWFKALKGDTSDNYKGVPGVGEKTALEIAKNAKSVEDVQSHPKVAKSLDEFKHSLMLAKVCDDVSIDYTQNDITPNPDPDRAVNALRILQFNTLIGKFKAKKDHDKPSKSTSEAIAKLVKSNFSLVVGESIQIRSSEGLFEVDIGKGLFVNADSSVSALSPILKSNHKKIVFGLKELLHKSEVAEPVTDILLAAYLDDPGKSSYDLETLKSVYLDDDPPPVLALEKIADLLLANLDEKGQKSLLYDIEQPVARVLCSMEKRGIVIDKVKLTSLGTELDALIKEKSRNVHDISGVEFNIGSPKQLGEVLFDKMHLPSGKKTKTGYSTAQDVLESLRPASPIIDLVLDVRELTKLKNTYVDTLPSYADKNSRIHTTYIQTGTATGRLSSTNPNLQNIPVRSDLGGRIRECFVAKPGYVFVSADYSQIELRLLACLSCDPELIKAFHSNEDIHTYTAKRIFNTSSVTPNQRRQAKIINFGVLYGMSAHRLSNEFKIGYKEAEKFIDDYFSRFSGVASYIKNVVKTARENGGYTVTMLGRRRYIPELFAKEFQIRSAGERAAVNSPIQGSAADIIKLAMINVEKEFVDSDTSLLLQIHDELVLECREEKAKEVVAKLREIMDSVISTKVPITSEVHIGKNLLEAK